MADVVFVVDDGLAIITDRIKGVGAAEPKYVAWGTGATEAAADDDALETAAAEARTDGTSSQQTDTVTNDVYRVVGLITSLSAQTIKEVGLFNHLTIGDMYLHGSFTGIPLGIGDSIQFTIDSVFDQA